MPESRLLLLGRPMLITATSPQYLPVAKPNLIGYFLAAQPEQLFSRSQLAALFWPDMPDENGRNALNANLWRLRRSWTPNPVRMASAGIGWDTKAGVDVDLSLLRRWSAGEGVSMSPTPDMLTSPWVSHQVASAVPVSARPLAAAAALWRGPFLDGCEFPESEPLEAWLRTERRYWEERMLSVLEQLVDLEEAACAWDAVCAHAGQALSINPWAERFHRAFMYASYQQGDRVEALRQYDRLVEQLQQEFAVQPDAATTELRKAIAQGTLALLGDAPLTVHTGVEAPAPDAVEPEPLLPSSPLPLERRTSLPLVGRAQELAQVEAFVAASEKGQGRIVLIQGEAGIGKSRLIAEVIRRRHGRVQGMVLTGSCYESFAGFPLAPVAESLEQALLAVDIDQLHLSTAVRTEVARLVPGLAEIAPDVRSSPPGDPDQRLHQLLEGVTRFMLALPHPTLLVFEDLHWSDEATRQFLAYLVRKPRLSGISILVTTRTDSPKDLMYLFDQLEREDRLSRIELNTLSLADVEALVTAGMNGPRPRLAAHLFKETAGHPLYTVELLRTLPPTAWRPESTGEEWANLPLPRTIQATIQSRLNRFAAPVVEFLIATALFPQGASIAVLCHMCGLQRDQAAWSVEQLVNTGILVEVAAGDGTPLGVRTLAADITFSHDMIRRVVLNPITQQRLQLLHRSAFAALRELSGLTPERVSGQYTSLYGFAEQMAYHAQAGGLWQESADWYEVAAAEAERVGAYLAAAQALEQLLQGLSNVPAAPETLRRSVDTRLRLGHLGGYFDPGRIDGWLAPARAALASLGDEERQAELRLTRSATIALKGRLHIAASVLQTLLPLARFSGNGNFRGRTLVILGVVRSIQGLYDKALELFAEGLPLVQGMEQNVTTIYQTLPALHASLGDFTQADELADQHLRAAKRLGNGALLAHHFMNKAVVEFYRGDWKATESASRQAKALARESGHHLYEYLGSICLGIALLHQGDVLGGLAAQLETIDLTRRARTTVWLDRVYLWQGELYLAAGRVPDAEDAARRGLKLAQRAGYLVGVAHGHKVLGQIRAATGDYAGAGDMLTQALVEFEQLNIRPEVGRTQALLATVTAHTHHIDELTPQ